MCVCVCVCVRACVRACVRVCVCVCVCVCIDGGMDNTVLYCAICTIHSWLVLTYTVQYIQYTADWLTRGLRTVMDSHWLWRPSWQ